MTRTGQATPSVTVADVKAAGELLRGISRVTPLEGARWLAREVGGPVLLKCENLQRAGSFKIRGAYTRISRLSEQERARGVVAASAGNHAQGVALAASMLGTSATVFMPVGAPLPKLTATRAYGATVEQSGQTVDEALIAATEFAERTGAVLIHPFDHPDVVAGQGTVGLEILEQEPAVRTVVVCTGGGGLLAGVAVAVKGLRPQVRVVGVQAEGAAAYPPSLTAGHPVALHGMSTSADGIAVGRPGDVPYRIVADLVDEIRTVSEEDLARSQLLCLERAKMVVEPAGAAALAAVVADPTAFEAPVAVVLSGGNVDPLLMLRVIRHGLAAAGRYAALRLAIADRPGSLARLLGELAAADANVVEVEHARIDPRLSVDEVEVEVQVETRGREHLSEVLGRLRACGYDPRTE